MHHIREGKHGAAWSQQAIAIGLSKAHRAGVKLGPPKKGRTSAKVRRQAQRDLAEGRSRGRTRIAHQVSGGKWRAQEKGTRGRRRGSG
jgi:hypothetical protein